MAGKIIKFFREFLSLWADVEQVASVWGVRLSLIYGTYVWLVAWLADLDWILIFMLPPLLALSLLVLWEIYVRLRRPSSISATFDVSIWTNHPIYSVWVAACLWVNHRPWPNIPLDHPAWPALQAIKSAIEAQQITALPGEVGMKARIRREELIRLAESRGERPRFLYPNG